MNILSLALLIWSMEHYFANGYTRDIRIHFNETVVEIDLEKGAHSIQLICTRTCTWLIPEQLLKHIQVSILENTLNLTFKKDYNYKSENLTICESPVVGNSVMENYSIPHCCPCCAWYEQSLCDRFSAKYINCSTIIIYSFTEINNTLGFKHVYENTRFILPCKMRKSHSKENIEIGINGDNAKYLKYFDGTLQWIAEGFSYNPSAGLCLNLSALDGTTINCHYIADNTTVTYFIKETDFMYKTIESKIKFVDRTTEERLFINPNQSVIKLLKNQELDMECTGKYVGHSKKKLLLCLKFDYYDLILAKDFHCEGTKHEVNYPFFVDTTNIQNDTKIICNLQNPSKLNPKSSELTIQLFSKKSFEILNLDTWNNKTRKLYPNEKNISLTVLFDSIPTNYNLKCKIFGEKVDQIQGICSIRVAGKCYCKANTNKILNGKVLSKISISIYDGNITKSVSLMLQPIYLEKPKLEGLDQMFETYKHVLCQSSTSKPYEIEWKIQFNYKDIQIHYSTENILVISLNDTIKSLCCECTITNELGSKRSQQICKEFIDVNIRKDMVMDIFLFNVSTWNPQAKVAEIVSYLSSTNKSIEVLDNNPIDFLCASRNRNDVLNIIFNNSTMNTTNIETAFTRQSKLSLDTVTMKKQNLSGVYTCQQRSSNETLNQNSTISIKILRTIAPIIEPVLKKQEIKSSFVIGDNFDLKFIIISFPPSKVDIRGYSSTKPTKEIHRNKTVQYKISNSSHTEISVIFLNFSQSDSGNYYLAATNILGSNRYIFSLAVEEPRYNLTMYYILAAIIVVVIVVFGLLFRCIQKSGYAVPIIQIQNSMYKSLDTDSVQLLSTIWPDPLERKKWTIKPSCRIRIIKEIGEGNYGKIYKGLLANQNGTSEHLVALKRPILTIQHGKEKGMGPLQFCQISLDCFMNEIKVLSKLTNCPNIIKMYGCTIFQNGIIEDGSNKEPTTLLVLEYCANRSLNEFLIKNSVMFSPYTKFRKLTELNGYTGMKLDEGLTLLDLKKISLGISIGLDYLCGLSIIHRDLATRNILIDDQKTPKICDFGLAIELETDLSYSNCYQILTHSKALPFKILAPEVLESKSFCLESDIWSFGLLLWQMFNLEQETLFPLLDNPTSLLKYIRSHIVDNDVKDLLPVPKYADDPIWKLINACWTFDPNDRPAAHWLRMKLVEIVRNSPVEVIRVSSGSPQDVSDPICRESISSSKFPSTRTSLVTLNYPILPMTNSNGQKFCFCDEFAPEVLIDESPL